MSAAPATSARARSRPTPRPAARQTRARRPANRSAGLLSAVVWIASLAVLLGGVVALNVGVLQLNVRLDRLAQERTALKAGNAALAAELSSVGAPPHVVSVASRKLGLVPAVPEQTSYVQLAPGP